MCGIAGFIDGPDITRAAMEARVGRMISTLSHRGPDDAGVWADPSSRVCLGNRRLAILDRSVAGHQPMMSASGRYVVTFNGEIYNCKSLRRELESVRCAPTWRGTSDTEVLVAAFDAWGIEAAVSACVGMFAIAVWDKELRALTLVRDRMGEKPLYFGQFHGVWLFGSELKALVAHPAFEGAIDLQAASTYMTLGYVPAPATIYRGVSKVRPGCMVRIDATTHAVQERPYWSLLEAASKPPLEFASGVASDHEAIDRVEALLSQAIAQQRTADRPVGVLLSGGVDSSCIVALMRAQDSSPIRTFGIGFHESFFNEAEFARKVASHFATDHTELYVSAAEAQAVIPLLPEIYDEPFADPSQIPTYLVSKLARTSVTVALTGDGGDELFGGYPRYAMGNRLWSVMRHVPASWRPPVGDLLQGLAPRFVDRLFAGIFAHDDVSGVRGIRPAHKIAKLGRVLRSRDLRALYLGLLSPWAEPESMGRSLRRQTLLHDVGDSGADTAYQDFMLRDLVGYLPDDILTKIDRAAMAVSLENRAPFLDHRVVEFAVRMPLALKARNGVGKWVLRQILYRHIPRALVDRPKMGFCVPLDSWLRGPLKEWAGDLISSRQSDAASLLDRTALMRLFNEHNAGVRDWHQALWTALMFLAWGQIDRSVSASRTFERSTIVRDGSPRVAVST